jgi:DNA modification methylase
MTKDFPAKKSPKALKEKLAAKSRKKKRDLESGVVLETARQTRRNRAEPSLGIVLRPIGELYAPSVNVRRLNEDHIAEVAQSIAAFGNIVPLLATAEGEVIDGVTRLEAARHLEYAEVPCIEIDHLSRSELKRLRLAVNRLGEKGEYDLENLRLELEEIVLDESVLEIPGFDGAELDIILDSGGTDEAAETTIPERDPRTAVARPGDIFTLGVHTLVCGDARDAESYSGLAEAGLKARLIIADFPYGCAIEGFASGKGAVKHREFVGNSSGVDEETIATLFADVLEEAPKHLVEGGLGFYPMDWRGLYTFLRVAREAGTMLLNLLVWNKGRGGMGGLYRNAHELIAVLKHGDAPHLDRVKLGKHGRDRTNVLTYPGATTPGSSARAALADHPTPKSVELIADLILDTTKRGEIVLDPFMGSGTTIIAAEKTGRIAYGIELDPLYVDVAIRRYEAYTGQQAVHIGSGKSFRELGEERRREALAVDDENMYDAQDAAEPSERRQEAGGTTERRSSSVPEDTPAGDIPAGEAETFLI